MPNKGWCRVKSGGHAHKPQSKQSARARGRNKRARLREDREATEGTEASRQDVNSDNAEEADVKVAFVDDDGERVVMEPLTLPSDAKLQHAWTNGQGRSRMQLQRYTTRYAEYIISCGPRCRKGQTINSKTVKERARRTKEMVGAFQTLQLRGAHLDSDDSEEITVGLSDATLKLLLKCVAPPFLNMARITKAKREITATINTDFGLVASEDGLSVSADPARIFAYYVRRYLPEVEPGGATPKLHCVISGDGLKTGATLHTVVISLKLFATVGQGQERKLLEGAPAPTSQEALFCAFIARCKENFEDLERFTANLSDYLRTIQEAKQGDCGEWVSPETRRHFEVEFYIAGDMKWLLTLAGQKGAMAKHFCFLCSCSYEDIGDFDLNWEIDRDNAEA